MNEEQDRFINCMREYNEILQKTMELVVELQDEIIHLTNLLDDKYNEVVEDDLPF